MPNHVKNIVTVHGDENAKRSLLKAIKGDSEYPYIDFNRIIKMPPELLDGDGWYSWAIEHWGTKWNAYEQTDDEGDVAFWTAWSMPHEVFVTLSNKYPTVTITVDYADEDIGQNCGTRRYRRGRMVSSRPGDVGFACEVWGSDPEEYGYRYDEEKHDWVFDETLVSW